MAGTLTNEEQLYLELEKILQGQGRSADEIALVRKAYEFAYQKHEGQFRKNGEKYIVHPVEVATILARVPTDNVTICSALMHDVLEDCDVTPEEIKSQFGEEILKVVEGVTKLGKFKFESVQERNAENFRKMFLAMADDIRVVLLKLADRMHNMMTLEHLRRDKQVRIARETLEVFAPLANRMGMGKWRVTLEDLSFKFLDPDEYENLVSEVETEKELWQESIDEMCKTLQESLHELDIDGKIYGRVKNYFSIYRKIRGQSKQLHDVYDLGALRIIVPSEKECYEALGIVHSNFKPIPGRFKDYIAMPKSNLYKSLHTTVIGPDGRPIEVQIRTQDMHHLAEYGIAAHWRYKEKGSSTSSLSAEDHQKISWLKEVMELKEETADSQEFVDNVKLDLFRDEVFVFTPKGDVFNLPRGSTPLDFAYRIHTEVGNSCVGAMVNGRIVPLDYQLKNGDIAEIHTSKKSTPKLDWIKFVQTNHARSSIRLWFKKNFKDEHIQQGRALIEAEMTKAQVEELIKNGTFKHIAEQMNYTKPEDLFLALGYGEVTVLKIMGRLKKELNEQREKEEKDEPPLSALEAIVSNTQSVRKQRSGKHDEIEGLQGMLYHMAKCCGPLPGDNIVGVVTRSRGVMIHRDDCLNLDHVMQERVLEVSWNTFDSDGGNNNQKKTMHSIRLEVHVIDRLGIFKDVLSRIADINTNVSNARVKKMLPNNTAIIEITVDILDLDHLERVINVISRLSDVISVKRAQVRPLKKPNVNLGSNPGEDFEEEDAD